MLAKVMRISPVCLIESGWQDCFQMQHIAEGEVGLPAATAAIQRPLLQRQAGGFSALSKPFYRLAMC